MAEITWYMDDSGTPTHQYLKDSVQTFTEPYPKTLWRIDSKINNGAPYHEYLPVAASIENNIYGYYNGRPIYRIFCNGKVINKIYYKNKV